MMYLKYAMENGHLENEIRKMVDGLFGADSEMGEPTFSTDGEVCYRIGGYILHSNNISFDVVDLIGSDGEPMESWSLDYS